MLGTQGRIGFPETRTQQNEAVSPSTVNCIEQHSNTEKDRYGRTGVMAKKPIRYPELFPNFLWRKLMFLGM